MLMPNTYEKYLIPVDDGFMIDPQAPAEIKQKLRRMTREYEAMYGEKLFIEKED